MHLQYHTQSSCSIKTNKKQSINYLLITDTIAKAQEVYIRTFPILPEKAAATNFVNLQLISTITGSPIACNWQINGQTSNFFEIDNCLPNNSNANYTSACENSKNFINFTHTIKTPLVTNVDYGIRCIYPRTSEASFRIAVQSTLITFFTIFFCS